MYHMKAKGSPDSLHNNPSLISHPTSLISHQSMFSAHENTSPTTFLERITTKKALPWFIFWKFLCP